MRTRLKGFTLVEVLLSISLFAAIVTLSVPIYQSFEFRNELASSVDVVVAAARTAQTKAQGSDNDTAWGIKVETSEVIIFSGDSFATRDTNLDISLKMHGTPLVTGQSEFLFNRLTGNVPVTGTITLEKNTIFREITINEKGILFY